MKTNIEEVRAQINEARARLANAEAELAKMEAKPAKWEPKGGKWFLTIQGDACGEGGSDMPARLDGSEYPTREAAQSASPYVTFYKRLCCLAQELNPSGKVGGNWYVLRKRNTATWSHHAYSTHGDISSIFESEAAACRAAAIMNRDNWQLP